MIERKKIWWKWTNLFHVWRANQDAMEMPSIRDPSYILVAFLHGFRTLFLLTSGFWLLFTFNQLLHDSRTPFDSRLHRSFFAPLQQTFELSFTFTTSSHKNSSRSTLIPFVRRSSNHDHSTIHHTVTNRIQLLRCHLITAPLFIPLS